jgi:hypothetical protein
MRKSVLLLGACLLSALGCPRERELCDEQLRAKCGCDPKIEALAKGLDLTKMDDAMFLEIKNCADGTLSASVKDVKYADVAFKGCIESSKKLDDKIKEELLGMIHDIAPSEEKYDAWLRTCYIPYLKGKQKPTLIVLMDSHLPGVVYCKDTLAKGGSNADDIANLLAQGQSRLALASVGTSLDWQDDQRVLNLDPGLIILHASAFYKETQEMAGNQKLINFLDSIHKNSPARVLVYTRGLPDQAGPEITERWQRIIDAVGASEGRFQLFVVPKGADPCFRNPDVGMPFKAKVREMLGAS